MSHTPDTDLIDQITAVVTERDTADARLTELLIQARTATPPIPLEALSRATGLTVSGVSVRVARALRARNTAPTS